MSEKKVCVSEQFIKQLQERNMKLEQQLKTALPEKLIYTCMTFACHPDYVRGYNQAIDVMSNNLEGK